MRGWINCACETRQGLVLGERPTTNPPGKSQIGVTNERRPGGQRR